MSVPTPGMKVGQQFMSCSKSFLILQHFIKPFFSSPFIKKLFLPLQMPQPGQSPLQMPQTMGRLKSDSAFPLESIEATTPVLYKRKRLTRGDVCPVEAWRLMMSLRSGLLAESCWALDTLNILLFDDVSVAYFGLQHMPGLLDCILEHFRKALDDMFDSPAGQTR